MTDRYAVALFEQLFIPRPWVGHGHALRTRRRRIPGPDASVPRPDASARGPDLARPGKVRVRLVGRPGTRKAGLWGHACSRRRPAARAGRLGSIGPFSRRRCRREDDYRVIAPVVLEATATRTRRRSHRRPGDDDAGADVQPVPGRVSGAGGRDVRPDATCPRPRRRARRARSRSPKRTSTRRSISDGVIDLARAAPRAALSGAADEAAVPRRLPGPLPGVRREPEPRRPAPASAAWEDPRLAGLKALLKENDDA